MPDLIPTVTAPAIRTGHALAEDEIRLVLDSVDRSNRLRQSFIPVWDEVLDNYLVTRPGESRSYRKFTAVAAAEGATRLSRLKDPETHQIIESMTAQALLLLLGQRNYITAVPIGSDDPEKARLLERLLMSIMEQPGIYRTHYQLFKNAFLFGTAIMEIGWEARTRSQLVRAPIMDPLGVVSTDIVPGEVVWRDRPLQREVDIYNFFPDPSGTRIQEDMDWVVVRFWITKQQAQEMMNAGVWERDPTRRALARLEKPGPRGNMTDIFGGKKFPELETEPPDQFGRIPGFRFYGRAPLVYPDRATNRAITIWGGERVMSTINPYLDGSIPFKEIVVNPISGRFYGLAPGEVIRFLQDATDAFLMDFVDAANAAIHGPLLVGHGFGGDPTQLKARRLLDNILCRDPEKVKALPVDFNALQFASIEYTRRKIGMREATGATNPLQAIPSGDRATATEVSELVRLASQRVEAMVQLIEREDYPWIGRTLHSRLRQFLPDSGAVATLAGEQFAVPFDAVDMDADVRFVGSRFAASKFQRISSKREAINVVAQNERALILVPELVTSLLQEFDLPNAEQIVAQAAQRLGILMSAEQAAENRGSTAASTEEPFGTAAGETQREGQALQ